MHWGLSGRGDTCQPPFPAGSRPPGRGAGTPSVGCTPARLCRGDQDPASTPSWAGPANVPFLLTPQKRWLGEQGCFPGLGDLEVNVVDLRQFSCNSVCPVPLANCERHFHTLLTFPDGFAQVAARARHAGMSRLLRGGWCGTLTSLPRGKRAAKGQRGHAQLPRLPEVWGEEAAVPGGQWGSGGLLGAPHPARFCCGGMCGLSATWWCCPELQAHQLPRGLRPGGDGGGRGTALTDRHLESFPDTLAHRETENRLLTTLGGALLSPAQLEDPRRCPPPQGEAPRFQAARTPGALCRAGPKAEPWALRPHSMGLVSAVLSPA